MQNVAVQSGAKSTVLLTLQVTEHDVHADHVCLLTASNTHTSFSHVHMQRVHLLIDLGS